jgi:hypothetical protein
MIGTLALLLADYHPFLSPLPLWQESRWPWLIVPLCAGVSIVYKSIKCARMKQVPREASVITLWVLMGMVGAAVALGVWVRFLER